MPTKDRLQKDQKALRDQQMRITRLHIQNFRSIKDLVVDLRENTVFIGHVDPARPRRSTHR